MVTAMQRIANSSDPLKVHYSAMSYKPFLSFFNMTGVVESGQVDGGVGMSISGQPRPQCSQGVLQSTTPQRW